MFGLSKKEKSAEIEIVLENISEQSKSLLSMINFLKDWGSMTMRKKKKLKYEDYLKIRNILLDMPLMINVAMSVVNSTPRGFSRYKKLKNEVRKRISDIVEKQQKQQIKKQFEKVFMEVKK